MGRIGDGAAAGGRDSVDSVESLLESLGQSIRLDARRPE